MKKKTVEVDVEVQRKNISFHQLMLQVLPFGNLGTKPEPVGSNLKDHPLPPGFNLEFYHPESFGPCFGSPLYKHHQPERNMWNMFFLGSKNTQPETCLLFSCAFKDVDFSR